MIIWTREAIANRPDDEIQSLRQNAAKMGRQDIVDLCEGELAARRRVPPKKALLRVGEDHRGQYVSEFHFVCPNEDGVTRNQDGTIWTGTWVVAVQQVENAMRFGTVVALHTSRAEQSYLQGLVIAWRKGPRQPHYSAEQLTQITEGILFLFQPSDVPLPWKGDATGEKGYAWASIPEK